MSTDPTENIPVNLTLMGGNTIRIRQIPFGLSPAIIIEPDQDDDGEIVLNVTASQIESQQEVAELLGYIVEVLEHGKAAPDA